MILDVHFTLGSIQPGESRPLIAWSDVDLLSVEIECFREPPQPPRPRPCQECGKFTVVSGEELVVTASRYAFQDAKGFLLVTVRDQTGDQREFRLNVNKLEGEASYVRQQY